MTVFLKETGVPQTPKPKKKGILLLNLGSPLTPTAKHVRPYLREFLSDFRVVDMPAWKWQPILNLFVLTFRPKKSAEKYRLIWDKEHGSPLIYHSERMATKLQDLIRSEEGQEIPVLPCMTYQEPSVEGTMQKMKDLEVTELLAIPMFPQYASCASGAALDRLWKAMLVTYVMPSLRTISDFWDFEPWQDAVVNHIRSFWNERGSEPEHLLFSFHSQPMTQHLRGDVYVAQCVASAHALGKKLGLDPSRYSITYQSKFGRSEWISPSTQEVLVKMGKAGVKSVDVFSPVFICDCLETLEELGMECKKLFQDNGGGEYAHIPCLNDTDGWVEALHELVKGFVKE